MGGSKTSEWTNDCWQAELILSSAGALMREAIHNDWGLLDWSKWEGFIRQIGPILAFPVIVANGQDKGQQKVVILRGINKVNIRRAVGGQH